MNTLVQLPDEIVIEILLRLPAKSVLRFKTVCKSWYSIINNTQFSKKHLNLALAAPDKHHRNFLALCLHGQCPSYPLLLYKQDCDGILHAKELVIPFEYVSACNSCHGLICFYFADYPSRILVWNPSLPREYKIIRSKPFFKKVAIAMGYDPTSDDYKVVIIPDECSIEEEYVTVKIFSFKSNAWKSKRIFTSNSVCYLFIQSPIYSKRSLYWITEKTYVGGSACVIYLDLVEESLKFLNLPSKKLSRLVVMNYKESIAIAGESLEGALEFWVLKDTRGMKSLWKRIVCLNFIDTVFYDYIGFTLNGEILVRTREGELKVYDLEDGRLEDIMVPGNSITHVNRCACSFLASPYIESLVSPRNLRK